jgi:hypothetical protein
MRSSGVRYDMTSLMERCSVRRLSLPSFFCFASICAVARREAK